MPCVSLRGCRVRTLRDRSVSPSFDRKLEARAESLQCEWVRRDRTCAPDYAPLPGPLRWQPFLSAAAPNGSLADRFALGLGYDPGQGLGEGCMAQIGLDTSRWPVPIVTPEGIVSPTELSEFFVSYSAMIEKRREPYVLIIDLRRAADMPAAQRKILTDYMKKQEETLGRLCAGTALIFESKLMKALLTAIFWVKNPPQEVRVFNTLQEAQSWGAEAMARKRKVA